MVANTLNIYTALWRQETRHRGHVIASPNALLTTHNNMSPSRFALGHRQARLYRCLVFCACMKCWAVLTAQLVDGLGLLGYIQMWAMFGPYTENRFRRIFYLSTAPRYS
jgi:hypothetical protein